jgi:nucleoside-diphosphate-sugar epimerase
MVEHPKLLVTGCNGFIGSHIVIAAIAKGIQVTGLSLHPPASHHNSGLTEYLIADISDSTSLSQAIGIRKYDYVINCSGYIDHTKYSEGGFRQIDTHLTGLMNLVNCTNHDRLKGFMQIGSSDEYGGALSPQNERLRESPISPYACAKVAACHFIQMLHRTEGFPGIVARLFLVYGPGQNMQRFLPQVISGCLDNREFPVSAGGQIRDFCYIDDVVEAFLGLLQVSTAHGQVFNVASGSGISIRAMIEEVRSRVGGGRPLYGEIPYREIENMSLVADIDKIISTTGWRPSTSLSKGIDLTVKWFVSESDK